MTLWGVPNLSNSATKILDNFGKVKRRDIPPPAQNWGWRCVVEGGASDACDWLAATRQGRSCDWPLGLIADIVYRHYYRLIFAVAWWRQKAIKKISMSISPSGCTLQWSAWLSKQAQEPQWRPGRAGPFSPPDVRQHIKARLSTDTQLSTRPTVWRPSPFWNSQSQTAPLNTLTISIILRGASNQIVNKDKDKKNVGVKKKKNLNIELPASIVIIQVRRFARFEKRQADFFLFVEDVSTQIQKGVLFVWPFRFKVKQK